MLTSIQLLPPQLTEYHTHSSDTPIHPNLVLSETIKFNNTNNPKNEEQKTKGSPQMIQNTHFTGLLTHNYVILLKMS